MYMYFTFILERLNSNFLCNFLNSFARKAAAVQVRSMAPHGGNILGCLLFIFCECSNLCLYFRLHLKVNLFDFPTVSPAAVLQQQQATASSRVCFLNILHQQLGAAVGLFKEFQVVPFFLTEKIWWLFCFRFLCKQVWDHVGGGLSLWNRFMLQQSSLFRNTNTRKILNQNK